MTWKWTKALVAVTMMAFGMLLPLSTLLHTDYTPLVFIRDSPLFKMANRFLTNDTHHLTTTTTITRPPTDHNLTVGSRFREREARVRDVCRSSPQTSPSTTFFLYSAAHNLIICAPPKAASSTWRTHFLSMTGIQAPAGNTHTQYVSNKVAATKLLGNKTLVVFKTAVTGMMARHPLDRLSSTFRDKVCGGRRVEKPQSKGHYSLFWKPILTWLKKSTSPPLQINFTEFVNFAMMKRPRDRHWRPVSQLCSMCSLHYHYILHLETFMEDLDFLTTSLNISTINSTSKRNNHSGESRERSLDLTLDQSTLDLYLQLPSPLLARVILTYAFDLDLFGYQIPLVLTSRAAPYLTHTTLLPH